MKVVELQAYRTFMFATVPSLVPLHFRLGGPIYEEAVKAAIVEAQELWDVIDAHVLKVAEELEND